MEVQLTRNPEQINYEAAITFYRQLNAAAKKHGYWAGMITNSFVGIPISSGSIAKPTRFLRHFGFCEKIANINYDVKPFSGNTQEIEPETLVVKVYDDKYFQDVIDILTDFNTERNKKIIVVGKTLVADIHKSDSYGNRVESKEK
jgi:hypothetical protein